MIPFASRKTLAVTLLADGIDFAFSGAGPPGARSTVPVVIRFQEWCGALDPSLAHSRIPSHVRSPVLTRKRKRKVGFFVTISPLETVTYGRFTSCRVVDSGDARRVVTRADGEPNKHDKPRNGN